VGPGEHPVFHEPLIGVRWRAWRWTRQPPVGGGEGWGYGGILALRGLVGQVWFWAARQASAPAGTPSGVGAGWLPLTLLRV
jgi:hypothetical protein